MLAMQAEQFVVVMVSSSSCKGLGKLYNGKINLV